LPDLEAKCREVGRRIQAAIVESGQPCGFVLMLFNFGEGGHMTYLSNADRRDVLKLLREFRTALRSNKLMPPVERQN
jgi:hypothetical protein